MTQKRKIITISDFPLGRSGVGTQARVLYTGLAATGKYSIRSLGSAMKHGNYDTWTHPQLDFVVKPIDGFGDVNMLRQLLVAEKPDALLLFTDPRFFESVWQMENEIRSVCPIAYWHLWDSPLAPEFNRYVYDSVDLINCINYHTYEFVNKWVPEKTHYVPHAIPPELYKPVSPVETQAAKIRMLGQGRADHFIVLYVSRNATRKMTPDVMWSFKMFLDQLESKHGHRKATLVMHTDPIDVEGTSLPEIAKLLNITDNVVYSKDGLEFDKMNLVYNVSDILVSRSCAEGFGLTVLEAKMAGKPVVALKTGGVGRQVHDHETGEEYGVALDPCVVSLTGNLACPYITNDYVSNEKVAAGIMKMYETPLEIRNTIGLRSREHALKHYNADNLIKTWDETLTTMIDKWRVSRGQRTWTSEVL